MKIAKVETFVLKSPLDEPFAFSQGWVKQRVATLVRISTDNGLVGWGEAFAQGLEAPEIAVSVIEHALKPEIMGRNPLDTQVIWHELYTRTRDFGRKGSVVAAISAIDIALWDIAGKFYQQPIYQLLGGAVRRQITPYATGFYRIKGQGEAARLREEAKQHQLAGFSAMKIKLGFGLSDDIHVMRQIADVLSETDIKLMVDTNHAYGYKDALRLGRVLEELNVYWYEEPVVPEDIESYAQLRKQLDIAIAGGENEHSVYGFQSLFTARALDIAQPDIGSCGGITAARDIVAMAQSHGVSVNPHVWGSAVAQAASLQLIATLPIAHHNLFPAEPMLEYDRSNHPFRQKLIQAPWSIQNGIITVPDGPGLGIEVQMETVNEFKS